MADVRLTATNPEDSSVVPVACDASGRLLLEEPQVVEGPPGPKGDDGKDGDPFSGNFADDVTFGGSAKFAGGANSISETGAVTVTRDADDTGTSPYIRGVHGTDRTYEVTVEGLFLGGDLVSFPKVPNIALYNGGSATFAGAIQTEKFVEIYRPVAEAGFGALYVGTKDGDTKTINGAWNGTGDLCIGSDNLSAPAVIKADGSATFASVLSTDDRLVCNAGGKKPNNSTAFLMYQQDGSTTAVQMTAGGSAEFAGNKAGFTAEGYLWCTTRRGDTVILDATSNGLASWVEYTPTTRIDDIRDELNAIRGDAAEMPADTP